MSGSGREAHPGCRETIPDVREWSEDLSGCPVVVRRPSWMSGSGQEALRDVWA